MKPVDYALVVGVSDYPGLGTPLPGARGDARRFYDWVVDPNGGGVDPAHASLIVAPGTTAAHALDAEPAATQIHRFFRSLRAQWQQRNLDQGSGDPLGRRLWVYLSGHGAALRPGQGQPPVPVLIGADAQTEDIQHVAGVLWSQWVAYRCFPELVVIFDTCSDIVTNVPLFPPPGDALVGTVARAVFRAAATGSSAWEAPVGDPNPGGRFTTELLRGLRGAAAGADGKVTADRLGRWLEAARTAENDVSYEPQGNPGGMVLAEVEPPAVPVHSLLPKLEDPLWALETKSLFRTRPGLEGPDLVRFTAGRARRWGSLDREALAFDAHLGRHSFSAELPAANGLYFDMSLVPRVAAPGLQRGQLAIVGRCEKSCEAPLSGWGLLDENRALLRALDDVATSEDGSFSLVVACVGSVSLAARLEEGAVAATTVQRVLRPDGDEPVVVWLSRPERDPVRSLVEASLRSGDATPAQDATREALRAWAAADEEIPSDVLKSIAKKGWPDAIGCLLLAARARDAGLRRLAADALAASSLPPDDPDVAALRDGSAGRGLPRLAASWDARLKALVPRSGSRPEMRSEEEQVAGRRAASSPWLAWFGPTQATPWVVWTANAIWPGWNAGGWDRPVPAARRISLGSVTQQLGLPPANLDRKLHREPAIPSLQAAERVVFLGASNDQLPAALAVAFQRRDRRRWARLDIVALDDEPLRGLISDGRTGAALLRDRDAAEKVLRGLLPRIAVSWTLRRSPTMYAPGQFASLWDLDDAARGWVHQSRYDGENIRTSPGGEVRGGSPDWRSTRAAWQAAWSDLAGSVPPADASSDAE